MKMATMSQVLTHRDPNHASDALLRLNKLRRDGILCDLTILVEGREYKAHKAVMAACSDYFLNAICGGKTTATVTSGDQGNITVDLEHVTLRGFAPLLDYAYTSNLQVNAADVIDVLSAASYMQMFKVANACSEFMRSNIMWSQSRLSTLPPSLNPASLLNGSKHHSRVMGDSLSPSSTGSRGTNLPSNMSSLLQASAGRSLGQPPLLIPIHSMAYDVGLQLAATMSGNQNLLFRDAATGSLPDQALSNSWAASTKSLSQSPSYAWPVISSSSQITSSSQPSRTASKGSSSPTVNGHVSGSSSRKSFAVKIESTSDDENARNMVNGNEQEDNEEKSTSPAGSAVSEPVEDSWQALQKLYSIKMTEESQRYQPYEQRLKRVGDRESSCSPSAKNPNTNDTMSLESDGSGPQHSSMNINCNNNNNSNKTTVIADFISKIVPKTNSIVNMTSGSPGSVQPATAAAINGAMHNAIIQQQILAAQQNNSEGSKIELPVMPPNGQYMSVRRRTLQSTVPKPHQCQICGSRFTRFHNLKQHIKLHSGIKPYECDECGKRFTRNYTLRLHKMKHVGVRNFRCGTCDASFTSLGEFRAHLRITMHSNISGALMDCGSPAGNSEPEDLSSPITMGSNTTPHSMGPKYSMHEASLLSFQRSMLPNDRAALFNAELSNSSMMRDGITDSVGGDSSGRGGSPQLSDRSISPQDLTIKSSDNRAADYGRDKMDSELSPIHTMESNHSNTDGLQIQDDNYSGESDQVDASANMSLENGCAHESSPAPYQADTPGSEQGSAELHGMEAAADRDTDDGNEEDHNNNTKTTSSSDQPISLVVNASA